MLDLLAAAVAFTAVVALGLGLLALVTLVPFVVSLALAERRGRSATLCGGMALLGALLGLGAISLRSPVGVALGLLLVATTPLLLLALSPGRYVGGRRGRH